MINSFTWQAYSSQSKKLPRYAHRLESSSRAGLILMVKKSLNSIAIFRKTEAILPALWRYPVRQSSIPIMLTEDLSTGAIRAAEKHAADAVSATPTVDMQSLEFLSGQSVLPHEEVSRHYLFVSPPGLTVAVSTCPRRPSKASKLLKIGLKKMLDTLPV